MKARLQKGRETTGSNCTIRRARSSSCLHIKRNKLDKPHTSLQGQGLGHVKMAYSCSAAVSAMLIACLAAESLQR